MIDQLTSRIRIKNNKNWTVAIEAKDTSLICVYHEKSKQQLIIIGDHTTIKSLFYLLGYGINESIKYTGREINLYKRILSQINY